MCLEITLCGLKITFADYFSQLISTDKQLITPVISSAQIYIIFSLQIPISFRFIIVTCIEAH